MIVRKVTYQLEWRKDLADSGDLSDVEHVCAISGRTA